MSETASSPGGAKPFISMQDVSLRLYEEIAFQHVQWEIHGDQQWAILGPNGSGKSTLVQAMCGQLPVARGRIVYHFSENGASRNRSERSTSPQEQIAYVTFDSQKALLGRESPFYQARWNAGAMQDTLPVSDYLSEHRVQKINPYQVSEERPDSEAFAAQRTRTIELLGIDSLLERDVIQLSNGERRKVLLAQALLKNPRLLILDNPFTGLDSVFRARLRDIIGRLMQDEMRIILVTNDRAELPPGITHILWVSNRKIVAQGPREIVLDGVSAQQKMDSDLPAGCQLPVADRLWPEDREMDSRVLVHMEDVNISYGGVQVLKQIDWTVRKGETWAVLGPNGAGKTTLLSLILGDNPQAYANDITLFGRRRGSGESIWDIKRHIGWVAPELHVYHPQGISSFDVVCSGFFDSIGRHHHCSAAQRETVAWWLQQLGMSDNAEMTFGELSEGEQRMILIARALVKRPALLILDEPCQSLDARNRDRVLATVETLGKQMNTSLLYVTHHLDTLPQTITHVLRLDEGRIVDKAKLDRKTRNPLVR